jgi:hypothetical protein
MEGWYRGANIRRGTPKTGGGRSPVEPRKGRGRLSATSKQDYTRVRMFMEQQVPDFLTMA